jgi:hypothetical protein
MGAQGGELFVESGAVHGDLRRMMGCSAAV